MSARAGLITPQLAQLSHEQQQQQHDQQTTDTSPSPLPELRLDTDYTDKSSYHHHHAADSVADSLVTVPLSEDSNLPEAEEDVCMGSIHEPYYHEFSDLKMDDNRLSAQSALEGKMPVRLNPRRDSTSTLDAESYQSSSIADDRNVNWTELDKNEEETKSEVADEVRI